MLLRWCSPFFWSEKSGYANHRHIHKKNINQSYIFQGFARGGEILTANSTANLLKNIIDWVYKITKTTTSSGW